MMGKRAVAAILALFAAFAFAGCAADEPTEQAPSIETVSLVTAEGASARVAAAEEGRMDKGGLLLEGDGASYSGSFNAVFVGNTELAFGFRRGDPAAYRRLTIEVASAASPSQKFSVVYESVQGDGYWGEANGRGRSGVYVQYGSELRTTRYWASDEAEAWQNNDNFNVDEALASPMFGGAGEKESEFGEQYGTLRLAWTIDGVLEIYVSERNNEYTPRLIAAFDGTSAGLGFDAELGLWGLPRMEIADGYTISFKAEVFGGYTTQPCAPCVYFNALVTGRRGQERTYPLTGAVMEQPPFYTEEVSAS